MSSDAQQYAEEWSTKTGRPVNEVYIPHALREETVAPDPCPGCGAEWVQTRDHGKARTHRAGCGYVPE